MFVFAIIVWIIAAVILAVGLIMRNGWVISGGVAAALLGVLFLVFSTYYTVEPGEAKVMKDWTGVIQGEPVSTPGAHWKEPWVDAIDFDVRNQLAVFLGDGNQQYNGAPTNGPQITFDDKDGVKGNMDIVVLYSIKPDSVVKLVEDYATQDDFRTKVIEQDIRAVPRDIPGKFTTIQMKTQRPQVAAEIRKALEAEWEDKGIVIEDVSLQEVRYSKAVNERFEAAQNAQTAIVTATADAESARIKAEGEAAVAVAKAKGEAEANDILAKSLTPKILQSRWIEAIAGSERIIVPQDFTSLGTLPGVTEK